MKNKRFLLINTFFIGGVLLDWALEMANKFKSCNNPTIVGAVLGTVINPPPNLMISALDGKLMISDCYVLDRILPEYKRIIDLPLESKKGELSLQPYEIDREDGKLEDRKDYKITDIELKEKEIVFKDTLKQGDTVLLISTQDNQQYFVVGKVTRVGADDVS